MFKNVMITVIAAGALFGTAAQAATACGLGDLGPSALACSGFYDGNLLNNAHVSEQQAALAALGFTWDGNWNAVEKVENLNGSHTVDFSTLLQGVSFVAFHFGNGQGGPGQATAFYKIDAGAGLDTLTLNYNASSNAVLYSTTPGGGVPEPATWAMMIAGFGLAGAALRRRRAQDALA
jgi:hypothetical protein